MRKSTPAPEPEPAPEIEAVVGKGRPTPKRRDSAPKRQPMSAPRTAKEANRLRKQQSAEVRRNPNSAKAVSTREQREAMRNGEEWALLKRDKGPVRRLARDWVDTHRMASNFLLLAFPLLLFAGYLPAHVGTFVTIGLFVLFAVEWVWTGNRIHKIAVERFGNVAEKSWVLGLYAGQRSFLPRRRRQPKATLRPGDEY